MHFGVITLFPEMFKALEFSIPGRAKERDIINLDFWNPRDFANNKHRTIDDKPYGGGPGMVMMAEPLKQAIKGAKAKLGHSTKVIYLSPQGRRLDQQGINQLAGQQQLILLCGRYEGIDERLIATEVDEEWSIGDYVISGGEFAAMVMIDALTRLLPGALGDEASKTQESFYEGLLDHPHYTRPEDFDGNKVPAVLIGGNHKAIDNWRKQQALGRTWLRRPDLLERLSLTKDQQRLLQSFIDELGEQDE